MQIMLHVPLVIDQVLYAYNKKKAGNIPKNVLTCWVNLFVWFFFLLSGIFQLWVTSVSVTGALQTELGSSWLWREHWQGKQFPWSWKLTQSLKAHPVLPAWAWLMKEHFPKGSALFDRESSCPSFLPFPLPARAGGGLFTMIAKAGGSLRGGALQKQLSGFPDSVLYSLLVHLGSVHFQIAVTCSH